MLREFDGKPIRVLVVWEPVLPTDWTAPSTAALKRIADTRATQYWDKTRLVSQSMGEHDEHSVVWDHIAVYPPGATWNQAPPEALYANTPVIDAIGSTRSAIERGLAGRTP